MGAGLGQAAGEVIVVLKALTHQHPGFPTREGLKAAQAVARQYRTGNMVRHWAWTNLTVVRNRRLLLVTTVCFAVTPLWGWWLGMAAGHHFITVPVFVNGYANDGERGYSGKRLGEIITARTGWGGEPGDGDGSDDDQCDEFAVHWRGSFNVDSVRRISVIDDVPTFGQIGKDRQ